MKNLLEKAPVAQEKGPPNPLVSVIVPSYRPGPLVHKCLASLLHQETRKSYEIILVDSSPERVGEQLAAQYPAVRVIQLDQRTFPGTARNEGLKIVRADIVAFTDTDVEVEHDWIERIVERFEAEPKLQVVAGAIVNARSRQPIAISEYLLELSEFSAKRATQPLYIFATANVAFRREIFHRYGVFVDSIKGSDALFARWMYDSGQPALFDPAVRVRHYHRKRFSKYLRNQFELGRGGSRNRRRYPQLHGSSIARFPILVPLLPVIRTVRIAARLSSYDLGALAWFLVLYPLNLVGLVAYTFGFGRGLFD